MLTGKPDQQILQSTVVVGMDIEVVINVMGSYQEGVDGRMVAKARKVIL